MVKTPLTIKKVFENPRYLNIIRLIDEMDGRWKSAQFIHLRYALCSEHGITMMNHPHILDDFQFYPKEGRVEDAIRQSNISPESEKLVRKSMNMTAIDILKEDTTDFEKTKFNHHSALGMALRRLKKLDLIYSRQDDKRGYNKYHLTTKGEYHLIKWRIKSEIDRKYPDAIEVTSIGEKITDRYKQMRDDIRLFWLSSIRFVRNS